MKENKYLAGHSERILLHSIVDLAIYMLDPDGNVATWNVGAQNLKGYCQYEILGKHFSEFYTPEDREDGLPVRGLMIARTHGKFTAEGWRIRKDGTRFWANVTIRPVFDDGKNLLGYSKITRDDTERKLIETQLHQAERRFRLLIDGVKDFAIYALERDGIVSSWHSGAEIVKGYPSNEILGKHFSVFFTEEDRAAGMPSKCLDAALRDGKVICEGWRVRKDGTRFWGKVVIQTVHEKSGAFVGFINITEDCTNAKKSAEQILDANEKLKRFASIVAHDLRAPLKRIESFVDILQENSSNSCDEELSDVVSRIGRNSTRMRQMLDSLHDYTKICNAKRNADVVNLKSAVRAVVDDLQLSAISRSIKIDIAEDLHGKVDQFLLQQVIQNLLSNAVKFRSEARPLHLEIHAERTLRNRVLISFADNGIGIDKQFSEKVFEMFSRLHDEDEYEGTGIGLAVCKKVINDHGGDIYIDVTHAPGTKFVITLEEGTPGSVEPETRRKSRRPDCETTTELLEPSLNQFAIKV